MPSSELAQIAQSASAISLVAAAGAAIGFVLQLLVAFYFGASAQTDAYFMALSTSEMLSKLLLGGSLTAVFLPLIVERLASGGRQAARELTYNVLHLSALAFLLITAVLGIFAEPFVSFIAPGFSEATSQLTVRLLRLLLPAFVILFLIDLATAALHALRQFTLPALLRLLSPAISIVFIFVFIRQLDIFSLALGVLAGSVLQLGLLLWQLRRQGLAYRFIVDLRDPAIRRILMLVYPFLLSVLAIQAAGITYRILVSNLAPGSLAALKYAEKITQLLTIMFLNSVTAVVYPTLSRKAAARDAAGLRATIALAIRLITLVTVPVVIGVALLRDQLVALVYQRGSFSAEDAALTSSALLFLVLGLTANGISSVLGHATLALQETRAAVAVTIASQAVALSLFVLLVPSLAHAGLALASSLVPLVIALLYFLYLTRFIPRLASVFWHETLLRIMVLAVVLGLVVAASLKFAQRYSPSPLLQLILPAVAGTVVFFGGAYAWRIPEMHAISAHIRRAASRLS